MAEETTKACPYCGEQILTTAIKCKHCGEFLDKKPQETQPEKQKKKGGLSRWAVLWLILIIWAIASSGGSNNSSSTTRTTTTQTQTIKHYDNLNDAYKAHQNYIWHVCQEWVKIISTNQAHEFKGPTYAGEYQGKFIVKGTDQGKLFRCEFVPYENEWGMNLDDVKRDN